MKQRDGSIVLYKNSKPFLCKDTIRVCRFIHRCPPPLFFLTIPSFLSDPLNPLLSLSFKKRALRVLFEILFAFFYMEDQYGMADLGQYMSGRSLFPPIPPRQDSLSGHRGSTPQYPYGMIMFRSDNTATASVPIGDNTTCAGGTAASAIDAAAGDGLSRIDGGGDSVAGRWPRQETLTLLEIRSRLDSKFKEANQKGPLWDEVSRIMSEEHAYQRSSKKCREKFENLYKYYKKTKEGKAGRQDGKHYRFFRQLEALYGETNNSAAVSETHFNSGGFNPNALKISTSSDNNQESYPCFKSSDTSLSLSNSCDFDPTSSDDSENDPGTDDDNQNMRKRRGKRGWKVKIKDFIDTQMKKLMDKQEAWMEKMMKTIEDREKETIQRQEEWRKQDAERMERERNLWASERAWIEARDVSLMDTLHKMARKEPRASPQEEMMLMDIRSLNENYHNDNGSETITNSLKCNVFWPECEISRLIQLRNGMESKFQQSGISEEVLWDEITTKMAFSGYDKSGLCCREKWESINNNVLKCKKKRKENSRICSYYQNYGSLCNLGGGSYCYNTELNWNNNLPVAANNTGNGISDTCLRYNVGDLYGRIVD
ncbi:trihelix transcription factor PTL-like [Primulina huaijiensis]|uniref:trihelix transcription factor PTL-like n=1 Tax=Primulina huaijiensis TaxID=1492673 RepID=UPI003CC6FD82